MKNYSRISIVLVLILSALFIDWHSVRAEGLIQGLATDQKIAPVAGWDGSALDKRQAAAENLVDKKNEISGTTAFAPNPNTTSKKSLDFIATYPFDPYAYGVVSVKYDGWDTVYLSDTIPAYSTFYDIDAVDIKTGAITVLSIGGSFTKTPGDTGYDYFLLRDINTLEKAIQLNTDKTQKNDLKKILNRLEHFALKSFS